MNISPARTSAFDILLKIAGERAYSSVLLPAYEEGLSRADAALCHEITLGVLRRQIYLDRVIDTIAKGKKLDIAVRIALRIGLYQIIALDRVPTHSAVNESVNLTVRAKKTSAKGFVNAVLRTFSRERPQIEFVDRVDRISVNTSHPRWLIEKWVRDLGIDEAERFAEANNILPETAFRILQMDAEVEGLVRDSRASSRTLGCWIAAAGDARVRTLATRGSIYLQDEASQIVANSVELGQGSRFLDVCAAPGGKTGLVARNYSGAARLIVAGDIHEKRVGFLQRTCEIQQPGTVSVVRYDAVTALPFAERVLASVLVDAPCSGTGTIRHNPEIRYHLTEDHFLELQAKQLSILENASKLLVDGGELIYSTCSVEPEENEVVAERFLSRNPHFAQISLRVPSDLIEAKGYARTWPHRNGMDGFFIAGFRRLN